MALHSWPYSINIYHIFFLILNTASPECFILPLLSSLNAWNAQAVPCFLGQLHLFQTFIWHVIYTKSRVPEQLFGWPLQPSQIHSLLLTTLTPHTQPQLTSDRPVWILNMAPKVIGNIGLSINLISKLSTLSFQPLIKQQPLNQREPWLIPEH